MLGVGVYTNYMPEQPIAFSHKVHAGENGVIVIIATHLQDIVNIQNSIC